MSEQEPTSAEGPVTASEGPATIPEATASSAGQRRQASGTRRVMAGLFWLLSCLAILVASVTLWAHQTLLTENGWGSIVSHVAEDPEVIESASTKIVDRVSDALGVEERIAGILPGDGALLAGAITSALEGRISDRVAELAGSEEFQDTFVTVNEAAHTAAMKVIRGPDSEALTTDEGTITLNLFPIVEGVLHGLQDAGVIDANREIPDLSSFEPQPERVARLESLLGRDIPDDLGTITLVQSDRLGNLQTAVRGFDLITVVLIVIALVCVLLALWLSGRRLRMVLWLAAGTIVALLLSRGFTRLVIEDITGALRDSTDVVAVGSVIEGAVDSLMWFTFTLIVVALIVAGLAILAERREELAGLTAEPASFREWLRSRAHVIGYIGLGIVGFVILWDIGGPDISLLAAALVGIVLVAVSVLGRRGPDATEDATGEPAV